MKICCCLCDATILAEDINLELVLAKCRACNSVFDFSAQVKGMKAPPAKEKRDRGDVPMPASFKVDEGGHGLTVTRTWSRGPAWFFLVFSGFWNLVVSIFVVAAASGGFQDDEMGAWFIWLFLTPFILIGLSTGYVAIAFLINRTRIEVRKGLMTVSHGPLPWPGGRTLETDSIDQLYCVEYVAYTQNRVPQYRIALHALTKAGDRIKVVPGLDGPEQGVYLEQLLEKHLGIVDRPVHGEHGGPPADQQWNVG